MTGKLKSSIIASASLMLLPTLAFANMESFIKDALKRRSESHLVDSAVIGNIRGTSEALVAAGDAETKDAQFLIGSVSKAFTGILLAKLSKKSDPVTGKPLLDLNVPVSTYIPELRGSFSGGLTSRRSADYIKLKGHSGFTYFQYQRLDPSTGRAQYESGEFIKI